MTVLKGLGTAVLSFLLFLSLTIFGIAFTLHSTLLSADFVAGQVEKIDVSDLAREIADEQIVEELPEEVDFLIDIIYDVIDEQEPWLKEQLNIAIYASYDFFLGKTDELRISIPLAEKKLELRESLWTAFSERLPDWLPDLVEFELAPYLTEHIDDLAETIPEEYLPPELADVPQEQLKLYLDDYLRDVSEQVVQDYLPEVTGLLESVVKPYFDDYYDEFASQLPDTLDADRSNISDEMWEDFMLARKYIGWFQTGYYLLIAFMVLLVAGIVLIHRNVKDSTRSLGIGFLIYGIIEFAGVYVTRNYLPTIADISSAFSGTFSLPASLETWLSELYRDLLAPLQWFSLGILILGVVLIVVSIVYRRRVAEHDVIIDSDEE